MAMESPVSFAAYPSKLQHVGENQDGAADHSASEMGDSSCTLHPKPMASSKTEENGHSEPEEEGAIGDEGQVSYGLSSTPCFSAVPPVARNSSLQQHQMVQNRCDVASNPKEAIQASVTDAAVQIKGIQDPWNQGIAETPDLVIEVAGRRLHAHRSVLAEKSDYFRARASRDTLRIKGVSAAALELLLGYLYTGHLEVQPEELAELIAAAELLQLPCAVQCAAESLRRQLSLNNCYHVLSLAKRHRLAALRDATYNFMSDHFLEVLHDPTIYGHLTGSERELILRRRTEVGPRCLLLVELSGIAPTHGSSSRPPSRESSRPQSPALEEDEEQPEEEEDRPHFIYRYSEVEGGNSCWKPVTCLPAEAVARGSATCVLFNYVVVAGGVRGHGSSARASDHVCCYNPATDTWSTLRPLRQPRAQLQLLALDDCLYAVGGECLFSVERYDPRMDRWTAAAPLPRGAFAVAHEAAACNGEIYVSGGSLSYRLLKYEPRRDQWHECPGIQGHQRSSGMAAHAGSLYRFDTGRGGSQGQRQQGMFVSRYNALAKRWSQCGTLNPGPAIGRLPFRCISLDGIIYCVSRFGALRFHPPPLEGGDGCFDPEPLPVPLGSKGVLVPLVLSFPEQGRADPVEQQPLSRP
uniref:Kelch repeat and BTB domain-containing protein 11 n=1 Tax=Geotrypetes seraphini TaxID=260995 RepID=A0A6P8QI03_GEOSA|nr:kelch repeat and BTB domain-containing protein 11 [Geotrypetes seraphini]XP_033795494.1 kelch repeat and BTB domain-containing protein 11 [Geotrypetes seraphini]XP_033795495.1 kelch repeat and BTB domain-containing protein 11 [Geotrypetes seraphini]XP_033795497.1 kelch repeat and BTB domain-containing protein 11 [Geotrypetes seraphini]XP_033795498.1 kelch repeat and BTB domain-containing protein 11 [Geotrypetes seraphini]XP_033795499.1 kelch repeat and BTB domain-containing protein 11 [Geot